MMKSFKKVTFGMIMAFLLFFCFTNVSASGTATTAIKGNNSVYIGKTIEVVLYVSNISGTTNDGGLAAFGGTISYQTDKLELVSTSSLAPFTVELSGSKLGGFGQNTIKSSTDIIKLVFKAKALGSATISYSGSSQPDASASPVEISGSSKTINITNPPSTNNYLSSLSVSNGSINFNKNTTEYSISVASNITSINIDAKAEDSGASVSGTGSKKLNYGNNKFQIVVTAASKDKKTYTINVTRKDERSSNNYLSSLSVNGNELSPAFNKKTTSYTLSVPFSVSDLKVNAKTEDSKSKVSVSGNNNLIAEETRDVTITVTAENGSKKVYTIKVTRGKDPNKKLSENNYLSSLTASIGILSPAFDKEVTNYEIWLPYEIETISFDYLTEDTKYAKVEVDGNETLQPGITNSYKIKVTAENEEVRTYTVKVNRAKNSSDTASSNTYLKSISLKNGKLLGDFDQKKHEYQYIRNSNFEIASVEPLDKDSAVSIYENGTTIYIIVVSSSGEYGIYSLKEVDVFSYAMYLATFAAGSICGVLGCKVIKR